MRVQLALYPALCLAMAGCGRSDELTREKAAELIRQEMLKTSNQSYALNKRGFQGGISLGYWNKNAVLTEKGKTLFNSVSSTDISPKQAADYAVDVTGIADAVKPEGAKEVQFTLSNEAAQGVLRALIISGGKGSAFARKFDDGWRIENGKFAASEEALPLSDADQNIVQAELAAESKRKGELYKQAMAPGTVVVYVCQGALPEGRPQFWRVDISDSSVAFYEKSAIREQTIAVLYKDIGGVTIESFYGKRLRLHGKGGGYLFTGYENCPDIEEVRQVVQSKSSAWQNKWSGVDLSGT